MIQSVTSLSFHSVNISIAAYSAINDKNFRVLALRIISFVHTTNMFEEMVQYQV